MAATDSSSLVLLWSLLLHLCCLHSLCVLLLLGLQEQFVGFVCLGLEVLVLSEESLELNGRLVKEHTGDGWSELLSVSCMDGLVNVVTNEVISVITRQLFELSDVDWRKLHESLRSSLLLDLLLLLLLLHHNLLLRWLLAHLLLTWLHVHLHVVLVVASSHGTIVVVLPSLVVVIFVVALIATSVLLHISSSSSVATPASMLVSLTTTVVLVSIVLEISLGWTTLIAALHTWTTLESSSAVLLSEKLYRLKICL